jgi:hypothetical protein
VTAGRLASEHASARAAARLGRQPHDPLELAVVLEAWSGVAPSTALAAASAWPDRPELTRTGERVHRPIRWGTGLAGVGLALLAVVWVGHLEHVVTSQSLRSTMLVALPSGLAGAAAIHRRFLVGNLGLGVIRAHPFEAIGLGAAAVLVAVVLGGALGGLVVLVVLAVSVGAEGRPVLAVASVGGPVFLVALGVPLALAGGVLLLASLAVVIVACGVAAPVARDPFPPVRVVGPAVSAGLFAVLAVNAAQHPAEGSAALVALVPTLVGLAIAASVADRLWASVPSRMRAEEVAPSASTAARRETVRVLVRSIVTYLVVWGVGSLALSGDAAAPAVELGAVGAIGLASLVAESAGFVVGSVAVVAAGLVAHLWFGPLAAWLVAVLALALATVALAADVDRSFAVRW